MEVILHDDRPAAPGEKHGPDGPTHAGSVHVDYAYQAEQWVQDIQTDYPNIVRIRVPELGREWVRVDGRFVERR